MYVLNSHISVSAVNVFFLIGPQGRTRGYLLDDTCYPKWNQEVFSPVFPKRIFVILVQCCK